MIAFYTTIMSNIKQWSTEVPQTETSERTPIYRSCDALDGPKLAVDGCRTLYEALRRGHEINPLGPCLGYRATSTTGFATPYIYSNYNEVVARVDAVAAGLDTLKLVDRNDDGLLLVRHYKYIPI
jgi:long-chain acyl-CoA synthetase